MSKINQLEKTANAVNLKLRKEKKALIMKVPVPIIYTRKGLVTQQSTVDYTGLIEGGVFVAFDAKETKSKTSFPLANIEQHQLNYLLFVNYLNGIAFFMIHFFTVYPDQVFIVPATFIRDFQNTHDRKSIPLTDFKLDWLINKEHYMRKVKEMRYDGCI